MFGWGYVQRYFNNRRRALFRYWDGAKWRAADPLLILRGIAEHPKLTVEHLNLLSAPGGIPQEMALEAFDTVIGAARDIFGIKEWNESQRGLTQAETRDLLSRFMAFVNSLKKSGSDTPTMPAPTATLPSIDNSPDVNTKFSPVSHSISSEQIPADLPGCC
jgi:hypothetical protein